MITLHMVSSLDGYVARKDNDVAWMDASWSPYDKGEDINADVLSTIDAYIMGSRTYELALQLGWPYGDTPVIVMTRRTWPKPRESVQFHAGDPQDLVRQLGYRNIWLVGGAQLCQEFMRLGLVQDICLTVVPILLGEGLALFVGSEQKLRLKEVTAFKNGMIDMWYQLVP